MKKVRREKNEKMENLLKNLSNNNPRAKTLIPVYGEFRDKVDALFDSCLKDLHGEYQLYTVYKDLEKNPVVNYGLVYADYFAKDYATEQEFLEIYKSDAIFLHEKLKESKLPLDYYFIMPYYINSENQCALYNGDIILTNELETK